MKQLLTLQDCILCGDCCYYYKGYLHLAPSFGKKEVSREFANKNRKFLEDKGEYFLAKCPKKKSFNYFFCAFKEGRKCSLKEERPFGCKLYPFNVMRDRKGNVVLGIDRNCDGLKNKTKEQIDEYAKYIVPAVKKAIKKMPFHIEPYQPELKIVSILQ